jgi:LCP family protein required for cell wall assembly
VSDNKPKRMKDSHSKTSTDNKDNIKKNNMNSANSKPNTSSKKRKKSNHKGLKIFFIIIAIILIIFFGIFMYRFSKNGFNMQGFLSTLFGQNEETLANLDNLDFLLIGESGNMTDSIMACRYDPKTQKAYMLSIPRDTFIGNSEANATTSDKINCVYNIKKDPMNTVKAVNKVTGLNLKYYVFVDTKALTEIVDAIGGVEFDVPIDMEYDDTSKDNTLHINLKKGTQKIDGNKAEQLLRFRHNNDGSSYPKEYGDNDLGRMHTQRDFIKATLNQTIRANNIFKLNELLDIVNKHVKTNLSVSLIKDYIPYAVNFDTENLQSDMLPNESKKINEIWFVKVTDSEAEKLVNDMFFGGTKDTSNGEKYITVELLNGTGDSEKLEPALKALENNGFDVVKVGNTTTQKTSSITNRTKQEDDTISKVKSLLNIKSKTTTGKDNVDADLTITLGKDYK